MTDEEVMQKNLTLSFEFSLYVTEHPEFASKIPKDSRVVLLPGVWSLESEVSGQRSEAP